MCCVYVSGAIVRGHGRHGPAASRRRAGRGRPGPAAAVREAKANLTSGLDKLSDADFAFKPTPDIRPYGALFTHVADAHYSICATAKGVANPIQGSLEQTKTTKADVVKALPTRSRSATMRSRR